MVREVYMKDSYTYLISSPNDNQSKFHESKRLERDTHEIYESGPEHRDYKFWTV